MSDPEDLAALARAYLGHATEADQGRILRMAGEGEPKDHEPKPWELPSATGDEPDAPDLNARPAV